MCWETFKYFLEQVTKKSFKISFACKSFFGGKKHVILFQSNAFSS